jgi:hypothetical protein
MVFVQPEAVEAEFVGEFQLLDIPSEIFVYNRGVAKYVIRWRDPNAVILLGKAVGQVTIALHMKPNSLHPIFLHSSSMSAIIAPWQFRLSVASSILIPA